MAIKAAGLGIDVVLPMPTGKYLNVTAELLERVAAREGRAANAYPWASVLTGVVDTFFAHNYRIQIDRVTIVVDSTAQRE